MCLCIISSQQPTPEISKIIKNIFRLKWLCVCAHKIWILYRKINGMVYPKPKTLNKCPHLLVFTHFAICLFDEMFRLHEPIGVIIFFSSENNVSTSKCNKPLRVVSTKWFEFFLNFSMFQFHLPSIFICKFKAINCSKYTFVVWVIVYDLLLGAVLCGKTHFIQRLDGEIVAGKNWNLCARKAMIKCVQCTWTRKKWNKPKNQQMKRTMKWR